MPKLTRHTGCCHFLCAHGNVSARRDTVASAWTSTVAQTSVARTVPERSTRAYLGNVDRV